MQNKNRSIISVLLLAAFIDVLGFSIIIPILPFWVESLGGNSLTFGILLSTYSVFQFITAPLWGYLSDRLGRKSIFMTGLVGSFISFGMLCIVALEFNSIEALFITRMLEGCFTSATLPTAYGYISDISSPSEKTTRFGFVGAIAGLGLTLGPFLGGIFKVFGEIVLPLTNGYWAPAFFATTLAFINLILAMRNLPAPNKIITNKDIERPNKAESFQLFLAGSPIIVLSIGVLALVNLSFSSMESILALFGIARITGFNELDTGILFLFVGILLIFTQGFLIQRLSKKFTDIQIITTGLILLGLGFIFAVFTYDMGFMLIVAVPIAIGLSLVTPSAIALISKNIPSEKQGRLMGLNESIGAFMRIIGPLIGTILFSIDVTLPWLFGALVLLLLLFVFIIFANIFNRKFALSKIKAISSI